MTDETRQSPTKAVSHATPPPTAKRALYFGCGDKPGHYLHEGRRKIWDRPAECHWDIGLMDTGLLKNGRHRDVYDGKVWWTCGGRHGLWYAFVWWDRSVDTRGACNSGFYVGGFEPEVLTPETARVNAVLAFDYACKAYPWVVSRQRQPLMLQGAAEQLTSSQLPEAASLIATDRGQLSDYQRPHDRAPLEVEREA